MCAAEGGAPVCACAIPCARAPLPRPAPPVPHQPTSRRTARRRAAGRSGAAARARGRRGSRGAQGSGRRGPEPAGLEAGRWSMLTRGAMGGLACSPLRGQHTSACRPLRDAGDCPCALSVAASRVRLAQDRLVRVCGAATGQSCIDGMLERIVSRRQAHCGGVPRERCGDHERSISHPLSRVTSGGGVAYLRSIAEPMAYTEASCLHAFASTCTPPSTVDKLREIERRPCIHKHGSGTFSRCFPSKRLQIKGWIVYSFWNNCFFRP